MARLTKTMKQEILKNAIEKSGVNARTANVTKRRALLADNVRLHAIGGKDKEKEILATEKKVQKIIGSMPKGIDTNGQFNLDKNDRIRCAFGGMQVCIYYTGRLDNAGESVLKKPSPCGYGDSTKFDAEHEYSTEFTSIEEEVKIIKSIHESIVVNVNAYLNSVTTDKKLVEIWPESAELLPTTSQERKINLPTVSPQQLNTMIGIPSEKVE